MTTTSEQANPLSEEPVRLRFGQTVILDCGPEWGGDHELVVGYQETTESMSLNGSLLSTSASRTYTLQDPLDASFGDATEVYR